MVKRYYRRHWDQSRGDRYDAWGTSDWLFETDEGLRALRQIEIYESGHRLRYGPSHVEDEHGGLAEGPIFDQTVDLGAVQISPAEFEAEWLRSE